MKLELSENGKLWYVVDDENEIIFISMLKYVCIKYMRDRMNKRGDNE